MFQHEMIVPFLVGIVVGILSYIILAWIWGHIVALWHKITGGAEPSYVPTASPTFKGSGVPYTFENPEKRYLLAENHETTPENTLKVIYNQSVNNPQPFTPASHDMTPPHAPKNFRVPSLNDIIMMHKTPSMDMAIL